MTHQYSLGSDNHSGVHPQILQALVSVNEGSAPSYGMDHWSQSLENDLKTILGCHDVFSVFNGTAANVLSLSAALKSYEAVLCSQNAHLHLDECAAPEKFFGGKLILANDHHGKVSLSSLKEQLQRRGDQHHVQVKMVSLTQPTELGTTYTIDELKAVRSFCDQEKLYLHIDGARVANAAYRLGTQPKEILSYADIATYGGSKNGLLFGDLVLINNPALAPGFKYLRKQALQLPSKCRFVSVQFMEYFKNDLWLNIAKHQCQMADYLATKINQLNLEITRPVESNAVFCILPKAVTKELKKHTFFYVWAPDTNECRLMTSFDTTENHIDAFIDKLKTLLRTL